MNKLHPLLRGLKQSALSIFHAKRKIYKTDGYTGLTFRSWLSLRFRPIIQTTAKLQKKEHLFLLFSFFHDTSSRITALDRCSRKNIQSRGSTNAQRNPIDLRFPSFSRQDLRIFFKSLTPHCYHRFRSVQSVRRTEKITGNPPFLCLKPILR